MKAHRALVLLLLLAIPAAATSAAEPSPSERIEALAQRFATLRVDYDPTLAYLTGLLAPDHSRFLDRRPRAIRALERQEDAIALELAKVPTESLTAQAEVTRAALTEMLESGKQLRVCRTELWDLSHFIGWQVGFVLLAELQPLGTPDLRRQALKRWASVPEFINVQTGNLRAGLKAGYSVPKPVVMRVIQQLDELAPGDQSPLFVMFGQGTDEAFRRDFRSLVAKRINPAVRKFRAFLVTEYLPKARETIGLSGLPFGEQCYQAFLRSYTTLDRTPAEVMAMGEQTVAENERVIMDIGRTRLGTEKLTDIFSLSVSSSTDRFRSSDELLQEMAATYGLAMEKSRALFLQLPRQSIEIERPPIYLASSGTPARYQPEPDESKPAKFIVPADDWQRVTRSEAEVNLVHETVPGRHLQASVARTFPTSILTRLADNSAYLEGWARYAEGLAEEAGMYRTDFAPISRRVLSARGMVVDPGIHAFGWTRERAVAYLVATGRYDEATAEATVDRIATLPGQFTAYDSGALEILQLRKEAEAALGPRFDIREFHQRVLERGVVPLSALRPYVLKWIDAQR